MKTTKMTRAKFMEFMQFSKNANTFSFISYFVNEGDSRTDKNYPEFDGKRHKLQKSVRTLATIGTKYKGKVDRNLERNGITFDWELEAPLGRFYPDYDKNRAICFSKKVEDEPAQWTAENAYLVFIAEKHNTPQVQYFHKGEPISREDARSEEFFRPSGLQTKKNTVKNSMFNKAMQAAIKAEAEGNLELAEQHKATANRLANTDDFKELEFYFRTVKLSNIKWVRIDGMEIHLED